MIKIGNLLRPIYILGIWNTRHKAEVCAGLPIWPEMSFINDRENFKRTATKTFSRNHLGFNHHRKPLQFSSRGPYQKTHLGFPKNLCNFQRRTTNELGLLNYVSYMFSCPICSHASRALPALVPHVTRASRALSATRALLLHVPHTLHALLLNTMVSNLY